MPVVPVIEASDFEHHWSRDERPFSAGFIIPAGGAATFAGVLLIPSTPWILVVEKVTVSGLGAACQVNCGSGVPDAVFGAATSLFTADDRVPGGILPGCTARAGTPVFSLGNATYNSTFIPAGWGPESILQAPQGFVTPPGLRTFFVQTTTANIGMSVTISGYLRTVEPREVA
jgi:hypothetical protein